MSLDGEGAELEDEEDTPTGEELEEEDTPPLGDGQDAGDQSDAYASLSDRREVIFERYVEGSRPQTRRASNVGNTAQTETNIGSANSSSQPIVQSLPSGVIPKLFPTDLQGNSQGFPQGIPRAAQGNSRGVFPQGVSQGFPTKYQSQTLMETGREQVRTSRWLNDDQGTLSQTIQLEHAMESSSSGSSTPDPCGSSAMVDASRSATEELATLAAHTRHMLESLSKDTRDFEADGQPSPKRRRITHTDPGLLTLGTDPTTRSISPSVGPNGTSTPRDSPVIFNSPGISGISPRNQSEMPGTNPAAAAVKRNLLDPFSFLSASRGEPSQTISSRQHSAPTSTSTLQNQNRTKRNSATVMFSHKKLEVEIPEISDTRPPIRHHPTHSVNVPYMLVAGQHSPYANRSASSTVTDSRSPPSATGCPSAKQDPTETAGEWAQHMTSDPEKRTDSSRQHSSTRQSPHKREGSNKHIVTFQTKDSVAHNLALNPTNPGSEYSESDLLHGLDMDGESDSDY